MPVPHVLPVLSVVLGLCAFAACEPPAPSGPGQGVLVIAIDGLRADHLASYGYDRETSPNLDALAAEGILFEQAFASSPQTLPAHVALLTGNEPTVARRFLMTEFEGLSERRWRVPERGPHLALEFLAQGYATAAFLDDEQLSEAHGFAPGFQHFDVVSAEEAEAWEGGPNERVVRRFLTWLGTVPAGRPWFAYLHFHQLERFWSEPGTRAEGFFPPRAELDVLPPVGNTDSVFFALPRSRWRGGARTLGGYEALYDDEIRALDLELARLFARLRRFERYDSTSIHVLGTHGMQFGEAGLYLRSGRYSRADLAVPWIFRPAGPGAVRGLRVPGLVSALDLAPTALANAGLAIPAGMQGLSQAGLADGRAPTAAAREFVFASAGLQEGCAVIGARFALEYTLPLGTSDDQLRRSWTGAWTSLGLQPHLVFYDRTAEPYPSLDAEGNRGPAEDFAAFRAAALEWGRDMNDLRMFLQAPPGRSMLDPATLQRLRDNKRIGGGS
ncbi:MAG: sulfatase [Planctomycetota bacterium]